MGNTESNSYKYNKENRQQTLNRNNSNTIGQTHKLQSTYDKNNLIKQQNNRLKYHEMFFKLNKVRKNFYLRNQLKIFNNNFINYQKKQNFELYKQYFSLWQIYKNQEISNKLYITQLNQINHNTLLNELKTHSNHILNIYLLKWHQYCKISKASTFINDLLVEKNKIIMDNLFNHWYNTSRELSILSDSFSEWSLFTADSIYQADCIIDRYNHNLQYVYFNTLKDICKNNSNKKKYNLLQYQISKTYHRFNNLFNNFRIWKLISQVKHTILG